MLSYFFLSFLLLVPSLAFTAGTLNPNTVLPLPIKINGVQQSTFVSLDSNWRWIHDAKGTNCFSGNSWDPIICPNSSTCSKACQIDGVPLSQWARPYGTSVNGSSIRLNYVSQGDYGPNYGERLYLLDSSGKSYQGFDLRNKEFVFTVDTSNVGCGINGAVYYTEMPLNNPYDNSLDASFGVNYGSAQCDRDIKYIEGNANMNGAMGACSNEIDIWEANSRATSMALHPCSIKGVTGKVNSTGVCDQAGADYNPNRFGNTSFYGLGSQFQVDSSKPMQVITRFHAVNDTIVTIERLYKQGSKIIRVPNMTDASIASNHALFKEPDQFHALGGFKTLSSAFSRKMVLILSIWDDTAYSMRWMDSIYPVGSNAVGSYRGPCSTVDTSVWTLRNTVPNSFVVYSDIQINDIVTGGSTQPVTVPITPTPNSSSGASWICQQCRLQ
jgi:cellulose 1,4-beta-cellobiosidase